MLDFLKPHLKFDYSDSSDSDEDSNAIWNGTRMDKLNTMVTKISRHMMNLPQRGEENIRDE